MCDEQTSCARAVPDRELAESLDGLIATGRLNTADTIAHVAEMERRRLYRPAGFASMRDYCVERLHLSEHAAFTRIRAARAARRYPEVLDMIADGRLHLTGIVSLYPHLVRGHRDLLEAAAHKSRREIERDLAERFPQPDLPTAITALFTRRPIVEMSGECPKLAPALVGFPGEDLSAPSQVGADTAAPPEISAPARLVPLAPERFALQTTISKSAHELLRRAQELLSHQLPSGQVGEILERALAELVARLEKQKLAVTEHPRPPRGASNGSRRIPASIKRAVRQRDGDQCTFVAENGQRCGSRHFLEFDHVVPVARGGRSTLSNVRMLCRAHNQYEAELAYGAAFMERKRPRDAVAS